MAKLNEETIDKMKQLLSSWTVFYQKTHTFHWDLTGQQFLEFHKYLQSLYEDSVGHIDDVAERLRQMGIKTKLTLGDAAKDSVVKDENNSETMPAIVQDLVSSIAQLTILQTEIYKDTEAQGDYVTVDLMIKLSKWAEFNSWFLSSLVGNENQSNM